MFEGTAVSFTKVQKTALNKAQELINEYCADKNAIVDIWIGKRDLANPKTGDIVGVQQTPNLDLYVEEADHEQISTAIDFLGGSGQYLKGTFLGRELIAIKARTKEVKKIVDGEEKVSTRYIIQFTKQNAPRVMALAEATDKIKTFDEDYPVMKAEVPGIPKKQPF